MNGVKVIVIKEETVKRSRTDSLKDYFWSLNMWAISPLWLLAELIQEYLSGKLWNHSKGCKVVLVKYSVNKRIGEFCTTPKRLEWLYKYRFFESESFADKILSIKKSKELEKAVSKEVYKYVGQDCN